VSISGPLLPPKAVVRADMPGGRVCAQEETHAPQQTASLFDHIIGALLENQWHSDPERLGGLEVDNQLVLVGDCTGRSLGFSPLRMRST
jgi:hypothetical protein